ncbi:MAG: penicillin acylase family protein [Acidobacteriota bacterium]|jgi:penicillin amidase|nr:penicillin acylase family protein [Acidobacteriota bacterium]
MKKHSALFVLFSILTFSLTACYAQTSPKFDVIQKTQGLKEDVIVRRDSRSIPYIEAKNEADLYFAQGFETARDRLWQMDLYRRVARGELAELFGKQVLEEDKRWRKFGFSQIAEESIKEMNPELHKALEDYARGVNAYIATLDKKSLPIEFQILQYQPKQWEPTDTIVIGKILADALSTTWFEDLNRLNLQQKLPKEKFDALTNKVTLNDVILFEKDSEKVKSKKEKGKNSVGQNEFDTNGIVAEAREIRRKSLERIGFFAEGLAASNNWVISGKRTADGKPILANDPHLEARAPGIWYLTNLSTPTMRVAGVTFPGVPGVVLGHNESIAWGATNVGPDVQDLYYEEFNGKGEYKTPTGWKMPTIRKEVIKVRKNLLKPETEDEVLEVVETDNGVIFQEFNGKKLALKWTSRNPENQEFDAFFLLNRAKNWEDFKTALKTYGGATQNFVYADVQGNIGWYAAGRIPIRKTGEGELPYNGSTNEGDWVGTIPFDELPHLYNPPGGFIVTANQRIVGTVYKYQQLTRQFAPPWRAKRIFELINSNPKITMDDVAAIQFDTFNFPLNEFAKEIVKRKAATAETLEILKNWNGRMTADSVGATVADSINACVGDAIALENQPAGSYQIRQVILPWAIPNNDKLWLPKKYASYDELIKYCDSTLTEKLSKVKGLTADKSTWKWGILRDAEFSHPLAAAPLIGGQFALKFTNVDGSSQTPNVGQSVSMRHIAKPGKWDETRFVIPLGQSGDPQSPFWKDQFESWRSGKSLVFPFTESAVAKETKNTILMMDLKK